MVRVDIHIVNNEDIQGNMDCPIEKVGVDMSEKEELQIGNDMTMDIEVYMDHPIGKYNNMVWGQTKVRRQVDTKVEIVNYTLY